MTITAPMTSTATLEAELLQWTDADGKGIKAESNPFPANLRAFAGEPQGWDQCRPAIQTKTFP